VIRGRAAKPATSFAVLAFDEDVDLMMKSPAAAATAFGNKMGSVETTAGRSIVVSAETLGSGRVFIVPGTTTSGGSLTPVDPTTVPGSTSITRGGDNRFGTAIANSARGDSADIDNDGFEDLIIAGGTSTPAMFVWYGPTFPTGAVTAGASSDHSVAAPAAFERVTNLAWVRDLNGDGLDDVCWSDIDTLGTGAGTLEVLY
jgi:hypothetical protein